jgi:hypothetical protein
MKRTMVLTLIERFMKVDRTINQEKNYKPAPPALYLLR